MISLLVYREYVWFVLLCIVLLCAEGFQFIKEKNGNMITLQDMLSSISVTTTYAPRLLNKDELTTGVAIEREGFSLAMPKIIHGNDSGKDHRRSNKFIEEDSNEFTEKYFKSKQCSIGNEIGSITMFGSNDLIGDTERITIISSIYDFEGKLRYIPNKATDDANINTKRYEYFRDCVYEPVFRSQMGSGDFRMIKKRMYQDINNHIINIKRCTDRFNTDILFKTDSDITADISKRISVGTNDNSVEYVSLIKGTGSDTNQGKLKSIQALNKGDNGDNASEQTYSQLISTLNSNELYKNNEALKQRHLTIYNTVYGYRKRIDELFSMMRTQTKEDASLLHTIRVSEPVVEELRMILSYLMIIQKTNDIIEFEMSYPARGGADKPGIYDGKLNFPNKPSTLMFMPTNDTTVNNIRGTNSILNIPLEYDTYNTIDEKRYLYGITYYFL